MNRVDDLRAAIQGGADVNGKDCFGVTPLHCAVAEKQLEAISLLLRYGADVTAQDRDGKTPLHYAVEYNLLDVAEDILKNDRSVVAIPDKYRNEPLWTAAFKARSSYEFVVLLLRYGADPNHRNNVDLTPLDIPKRKGDEALLRILESPSPGPDGPG